MSHKYCFLSTIFEDSSNSKVYETVTFEDFVPFSFDIDYITDKEVKEISTDKNYTTNFYVSDGYLVWDGRSIEVSPEELSQIRRTRHIKFTNFEQNIYNFLFDLLRLEAKYIPSKCVESEEDPTEDLVSFKSLKVSKSTMNVYLTVLREDGWRTRSIVAMRKGNIRLFPFHFVCKRNEDLERKYPSINFVKNVLVGGREYAIYNSGEKLIVYPMFEPFFKLCEPMLSQKIYKSERDAVVVKFLSFFISSTLQAKVKDRDRDEDREQVRPVYNEDSKYNVLFRINNKSPNQAEMSQMIRDSLYLFEKIDKDNFDPASISNSLRNLGHDSLRSYACLVLLKGLVTTNVSLLDRIDCVRQLLNTVKIQKLIVDLELFAYRAYIYMTDFKFPYDTENYFLHGGLHTRNAEIIKKIKDGTR